MKITAIEAIPYSIPYVKPLCFASGEVHSAEYVLVQVHTDEGLVGVADAPPRPFTYGETQRSVIGVIERIFAPQLTGMDVFAREQVHARLHRTVGNPAAKSAIDMALWDIAGHALDQPVTQLLGGYTDRMRVSHMLGFDAPARMAVEAERIRDTYGITTFKVKVGRRPITLDLDVCRALRETLCDEAELYVDGNRGWTASESAVQQPGLHKGKIHHRPSPRARKSIATPRPGRSRTASVPSVIVTGSVSRSSLMSRKLESSPALREAAAYAAPKATVHTVLNWPSTWLPITLRAHPLALEQHALGLGEAGCDVRRAERGLAGADAAAQTADVAPHVTDTLFVSAVLRPDYSTVFGRTAAWSP